MIPLRTFLRCSCSLDRCASFTHVKCEVGCNKYGSLVVTIQRCGCLRENINS